VFPVRYELGFYIPEDDNLHSHRRENLKSYTAKTETDRLGWPRDYNEITFDSVVKRILGPHSLTSGMGLNWIMTKSVASVCLQC
jgi:hypothetical protein